MYFRCIWYDLILWILSSLCKKLIHSSFLRCGGCGWPICGGGCSGLGGRAICRGGHSTTECNLLKSYTGTLTNHSFDIITPLRCLILRQEDPARWNQIIRMESHDEIRRNIPVIRTKNQITVVEPIKKIMPDCPEELIHTICGFLEVIYKINSEYKILNTSTPDWKWMLNLYKVCYIKFYSL